MFIVLVNLQVLVSIDRFWAIGFPMSYMKQKSARRRFLNILLCIIVGASFGTFSGLYVCVIDPMYNPLNNNTMSDCWNFRSFELSFKGYFSVYLTISILIIIGLNGHIILSMVRRVSSLRRFFFEFMKLFFTTKGQRVQHLFAGDSLAAKRFAKEMEVAKTMMMIIGSFVICWLPYTIRTFAEFITNENYLVENYLEERHGAYGKYLGKVVRSATFHLTVLNSIFDPLIYFFRMREIRRAAKVHVMCQEDKRLAQSEFSSMKTITSNLSLSRSHPES
jgi:7 transmembrane receptor (rhodopsin family)